MSAVELFLINDIWFAFLSFKILIEMKKIINTTKAPSPVGPYNQSVLAGGTLYLSGQIALDAKTGELVMDTIEQETEQVMTNLSYVLAEAGMTFDHIVKCSVFVSDMKNYAALNAVYAKYFDEATAPARELVEVANLPKYVNVEISAIAVK
jgi:2-iminobutanoate/2-iminopropanoate deaminase